MTSFRQTETPATGHIHCAGWLSVHIPRQASEKQLEQVSVARSNGQLPRAENVLAVTARPGQESADLGALLYAFRRAGANVSLLSLTRGEASELNSTYERLETVRPLELQVAAHLLGISSVAVADYPDRGLGACPMAPLTERVKRAIGESQADLLLVLDPAEGDLEDATVAAAACLASEQTGVPTLAHTRRAGRGQWVFDLGDDARRAREVQRSALAAHASQAEALPYVERRLAQLDGHERLRWLVPALPI